MEDDKIRNEESLPEADKNGGESVNDGNAESSPGLSESIPQKSHANKKLMRTLRGLLIFFLSILSVLFISIYIIYFVPVLQEMTSGQNAEITSNKDLKTDAAYKKQTGLMTKDIQRLSRKYNGYTSGQSYIVINTTDNRFSLYL
jgi:hypothetical protein